MSIADSVSMQVNGVHVRVDAPPDASLLGVLREELGLTGAKPACGEGMCGACSVLVGDRVVRSCITAVAEAAGTSVTTIEGVGTGGRLHRLQQSFLDAQALQCGYCTPGMIMAALGLLTAIARPTEAEIVAHMQGNICRCGCYTRIVAAIGDAAQAIREAPDA